MAEPNIADWLTAAGTVGTLAVTVSLIFLDRAQRQKREFKSQAVLISGWADSIKATDQEREVYVANMSDEPVYNVNVFLQDEENVDTEISGNKGLINNRFLSVLPPKQRASFKVRRKKPASPGPRTVPRVGLLFNDRNNTRWFRNWDGKVTPADGQEYDHNFHRAKNPSDNIGPLIWKSLG